MGSRILAAILVFAAVSACSSTSTERTPQADTEKWSAVGVPSRPPAASAPAVVPPIAPDSKTISARPGTPTQAGWASGFGAPPFPRPSSVNQHSPDAVALTGACAMASADTAVDDDPEHTAVRAALAGWLTPRYAHAQVHAAISGPAGAEWSTWTRHRAYVVVTARLSGDDRPPNTATAAARMVLITARAVGRDGWRSKAETAVVAVVLKRVDGVWRIDDEQTS